MKKRAAGRIDLPLMGQGTCFLGENPDRRMEEEKALRYGLERGLTLIDTAEMYGDGQSEEFIGRALRGIDRDSYMLCSKVYPYNAGREHIFKSCEASLKRLGTDYLDLYLLHWRGEIPLAETVECMQELKNSGRILNWGVSNFDTEDMEELFSIDGGEECAADQVMYHIGSRGIEYDLLPYLREHQVEGIAYCPMAQAGRLYRMRDIRNDHELMAVADKYGITLMQLLLAFVLRRKDIIPIPKASTEEHMKENADALQIRISEKDWSYIDSLYTPPTDKLFLDME